MQDYLFTYRAPSHSRLPLVSIFWKTRTLSGVKLSFILSSLRSLNFSDLLLRIAYISVSLSLLPALLLALSISFCWYRDRWIAYSLLSQERMLQTLWFSHSRVWTRGEVTNESWFYVCYPGQVINVPLLLLLLFNLTANPRY